MALLDIVTKGTTDYSCTIRIVDATDGTPETGVVFNTTGIDLWYRRPGAAHTSITEATQTESGAHTDGGFVHISDGEYRLDLPDAAVATGVDYVDVGGAVTGMVVIGGRIRLTDVNLSDGTRAGLTALPNAAADAAGGLPISDAGGLDLDGLNTNVSAILVDTGTTLDGKIDVIDGIVDAILLDTGTDGVVVAAASKDAPQKNVALSDLAFYMVDSTDHVTPETGLTVTVQRSIDGGAFNNGTGTVSEIGNGFYSYDASQADMNGNLIIFKFTATGADPVGVAIATTG